MVAALARRTLVSAEGYLPGKTTVGLPDRALGAMETSRARPESPVRVSMSP
jgi:hypothetical protein